MYRTDKYDQSSAPRTFADLTDEAYAGQVGMADPGVAAPAYPLAAYFFDRLGMDGGKAYFNQLFSQGLKVYPKNPQVVQALASGEPPVGHPFLCQFYHFFLNIFLWSLAGFLLEQMCIRDRLYIQYCNQRTLSRYTLV